LGVKRIGIMNSAQIDPTGVKFVLSFMWYAVVVLAITMAAATILGTVAVWRVREGAVKPMLQLIAQGDALRMLTVIFLVCATCGLVILGPIKGDHAATILSGIGGYVLGSGRTSGQRSKADPPNEGQKDR
jgi:hypothetical protein